MVVSIPHFILSMVDKPFFRTTRQVSGSWQELLEPSLLEESQIAQRILFLFFFVAVFRSFILSLSFHVLFERVF